MEIIYKSKLKVPGLIKLGLSGEILNLIKLKLPPKTFC